jgi:hypothetical protein
MTFSSNYLTRYLQVIAAQNEHLAIIERESVENRQRQMDLPPMSDSDDET